METEASATLRRDFSGPSRLLRTADLRYMGQNYDVNCTVPSGPLTDDNLNLMGERFESEHMRLYGHAKSGEPIEVVSLRTTILGIIERPELQRIREHSDIDNALLHTRPVFFEEGGYLSCSAYGRTLLGAGSEIPGPAIIEEADSTTVIYPGQRATVNPFGSLIIDIGDRSR